MRGGKYDVDGNKYLTSLRGFPLEFKGRFSSDELQCWFSLDERLQIINNGIYYGFQWWNDSRIGPDKASSGQIQFVATSFSPEYIQELIDKNPEKMAVILKGSVKDPLFKGLKWPESLKGEVDLLSDVTQSHFLWSGHDDCSSNICFLQVLDYRNVLIKSPRRGINDQVVQVSPNDISEELLDETILSWTSPNDCIILGWQEESN